MPQRRGPALWGVPAVEDSILPGDDAADDQRGLRRHGLGGRVGLVSEEALVRGEPDGVSVDADVLDVRGRDRNEGVDAGLLMLLCGLGCYAQVRVGPQGARVYATAQTLGVYVALAHIPAFLAAIVLHETLKTPPDGRLRHLPATFAFGMWDYSLYCVGFFALTGLVIGLVGETFLRDQRRDACL